MELTAGPIEYDDTGGTGPVIVMVHGLLMDGRQWRHVTAALGDDFRCIRPTLPMGAHRRPMRPDADLSLRGLGRIIAEFLDELDLRDVTLCFNDWCGAQVMIADGLADRVGRLVLASCEAFDNYPPGIPGRLAALAAKLPGGVTMMRRTLLFRPLRDLPIGFGAMSKRKVPDEVVRSWLEPLARQRDPARLPKVRRGHAGAADGTSWLPPMRSKRSIDRCSSCGLAKTGSCHPSTAGVSPRPSPMPDSSKSPTATPSSPKTNPPCWPPTSESSPLHGPTASPGGAARTRRDPRRPGPDGAQHSVHQGRPPDRRGGVGLPAT